ncbi:MAG: hypothetical protein ACMUIU_18170 [bacterium]
MKGIILASSVTSGFIIFIFLSIFKTADGHVLLKIALASMTVTTLSVSGFYIYFLAIKGDNGHVVTKTVLTSLIALASFITAVTCTGGCLATYLGHQNNGILTVFILFVLIFASFSIFFLMWRSHISKTIGWPLIGFFIFIVSLIGTSKQTHFLPLGGNLGILEIFIIGMIALVFAMIFFALSRKLINEYAYSSIFTRKQIIGSMIISCCLAFLISIPLFMYLMDNATKTKIFGFLFERGNGLAPH